jgi:hypothetical protein
MEGVERGKERGTYRRQNLRQALFSALSKNTNSDENPPKIVASGASTVWLLVL